MKRDAMISLMKNQQEEYDLIIIGGGATGIGIALESITRGYKTLLVEKSDFTKSTSSKSTKLVHGGVRYLAQGNIALVREACIERGRLLKNAPHLVKNQTFIIPTFGFFDEIKYTLGLTLYDMLAGKYSLGRSLHIPKQKVLQRITTLNPQKFTAGVVYHDGQFDDSRLAINVLQTAAALGAHIINYMPVSGLSKNVAGKVDGIYVTDLESSEKHHIKGQVIINATGVFADEILQMDTPGIKKIICPSQGIHIVLDKSFLPGTDAIMIPKTDDGRVLFAVPWHNRVVAGTTDTPLPVATLEPVALEEEIDFILTTTGRYLTKAPSRKDVLSVFAGLRPLAAPDGNNKKTREISRSHKIFVSKSGLFTMVGGKWTTFRRMAEDMLKKVESTKSWKTTRSKTRNLRLHGYMKNADVDDPLYFYGTDRELILNLVNSETGLQGILSTKLGLRKAQVVWAVRNEMARTIEDVLSRRTRCLLLDAAESLRIAPEVAAIMAKELNRDDQWIQNEICDFKNVAANYILE
jgi:glycerol-3-phosphate dehydrogenase